MIHVLNTVSKKGVLIMGKVLIWGKSAYLGKWRTQKVADELVFRRFLGEGVKFFQIGPH